MFTDTNIDSISILVKDQFPDFYKEHGPDFIEFVKLYYKWLEQENNPIYEARNRYKSYDIDTADAQALDHFRQKYMAGLPAELLGNQRLLQKHILELYRSKGAQQSIRLLFRLLFNEDIDFYIPSYDVFKLSDNTWLQPKYLEVTNSPHFSEMIGQIITGADTRASAIVEGYEQRFVNSEFVHILTISNVRGNFKPKEKLLIDGMDPFSLPIIIGSVTTLDVVGSSNGIVEGGVFIAQDGEYPVTAVVTKVIDGTGTLQFDVVKPGTYYSQDAIITITRGPGDPAGVNAEVYVNSLKNAFNYDYVYDKLAGYLNVPLSGPYPFPKLPTSNTATIMAMSLNSAPIMVGEIDTLLIVNPGINYQADAIVTVIDPYTSTSGILDSNGVTIGTNAVITGKTLIGTAIASEAVVFDSGYNNLKYNQLIFRNTANSAITITARPVIGSIGWGEGRFGDSKSFLSSDKYLFDGHYYQEYSYVIKAAQTIDKYLDILKQVAHPAGNAVYGDVKVSASTTLLNDVTYTVLKQEPL